MKRRLSVDVVIPTKERPAALRSALRSLAAQSCRPRQIVVIDGSRQADREAELADAADATDGRLLYCWVPGSKGLTASRNCGVDRCTADIVQFMDDDTTLSAQYLELIAAAFDDATIGGVGGQMVDAGARSWPLKRWWLRVFYTGPFRQRKEELFLAPPRAIADTNTLAGASAYRRTVFDRHRYDEHIANMIGEDVDFSFRVARDWRLVIEPAARMTHTPWPANRPSLRAQYAAKTCFFYYHFRKNMAGTTGEWVAFAWMNAGIAVDALLRGRRSGLCGVVDGWRRIAGARQHRRIATAPAIDEAGI